MGIANQEAYHRELLTAQTAQQITTVKWAESTVEQVESKAIQVVQSAAYKLGNMLALGDGTVVHDPSDAFEAKVDIALHDLCSSLWMQLALDKADAQLSQANDSLACRIEDVEQLQKEVEKLGKCTLTLTRTNDILRKWLDCCDARLLVVPVELNGEPQHGMEVFRLGTGHGYVIPDTVRDLVNELVCIGLKMGQISHAISTVANAIGVPIQGKIST